MLSFPGVIRPFSGNSPWVLRGRVISYVQFKFGDDRLENKNFRVPGVIRLFSESFTWNLVGCVNNYVSLKFGKDRMKSKIFIFLSVI
jgi:hypothetical protein